MSQVRLQQRPRRVPRPAATQPPPFEFTAVPPCQRESPPVLVPLRFGVRACGLVGCLIDLMGGLTALTMLVAVHVTIWSYGFDMGPAADCAGLPCPPELRAWVLVGCSGLALISYATSRVLVRRRWRATSSVLLVLVTLDLAATLLLIVDAV